MEASPRIQCEIWKRRKKKHWGEVKLGVDIMQVTSTISVKLDIFPRKFWNSLLFLCGKSEMRNEHIWSSGFLQRSSWLLMLTCKYIVFQLQIFTLKYIKNTCYSLISKINPWNLRHVSIWTVWLLKSKFQMCEPMWTQP